MVYLYKYYCINGLFIIQQILESEFDGIVSKRDKLHDLNFNQIKLEEHGTWKKITK